MSIHNASSAPVQPATPAARCGITAAVAAATIALAACSSPPTTTQVEANFHRVGVVSVAADELTQRRVGARERDDERKVRNIAPWGVDRAYEAQLAGAVQAALGAVPVVAPHPYPEFASLNDPSNPYVQPGFWAYRGDPTAAAVRAYCADNQLDAVVVATRSVDDDVLGGTYHPLDGAGVYAHGGSTLLHLSAALSLLDCATGRPLESHRVASGNAFAASHGYPVRDLTAALMNRDMGQWTSDDEARLKQALIDLPADAWVQTLNGMVHPEAPVIFGRTLLPNS
jgi:hypothetical protein